LLEAAKPWISSEKGLVKLAAALFNGSWKADINDVFQSLAVSRAQAECALREGVYHVEWERA